METIGEKLRRVRRTCGYSLDDVARETKINIRYLDAIEKDEFSKLPGELFLRGFLRSYAKFIGMNEKEILGRIKEINKTEVKSDDSRVIKEKRAEGFGLGYVTAHRLKVILPVSAVVVILLMMIILFAGGRDTSTIDNSRQVEVTAMIPAEEEASNQRLEQASEQISERENVQPASEPVHLTIIAKEATWIQATINGSEEKDVLLQPGEVVSWDGEEKIMLTVGNAGGIDLEVNGKIQEPLGLIGEVARNLIVTGKGISRP